MSVNDQVILNTLPGFLIDQSTLEISQDDRQETIDLVVAKVIKWQNEDYFYDQADYENEMDNVELLVQRAFYVVLENEEVPGVDDDFWGENTPTDIMDWTWE